jgi:hypothetical protein
VGLGGNHTVNSKDHKKTVWEGTKAAILTGVIVGFVGGILSIIAITISPAILELAIQQAAAVGAEGVVRFMSYLAPITGAVSNGILGLIAGVIGAFIGKKLK